MNALDDQLKQLVLGFVAAESAKSGQTNLGRLVRAAQGSGYSQEDVKAAVNQLVGEEQLHTECELVPIQGELHMVVKLTRP